MGTSPLSVKNCILIKMHLSWTCILFLAPPHAQPSAARSKSAHVAHRPSASQTGHAPRAVGHLVDIRGRQIGCSFHIRLHLAWSAPFGAAAVRGTLTRSFGRPHSAARQGAAGAARRRFPTVAALFNLLTALEQVIETLVSPYNADHQVN